MEYKKHENQDQRAPFAPPRSKGWLRVWIVLSALWVAVVVGWAVYDWNGFSSTYFLDVTRQPGWLTTDRIDQLQRRLRQEILRPAGSNGLTVDDESNPYVQVLYAESRKAEGELEQFLGPYLKNLGSSRNTRIARTVEITGLEHDAVESDPEKAERLAAIMELRSAMGLSSILREQVTGPSTVRRQLAIHRVLAAVLIPPVGALIISLLIWNLFAWIVAGFRDGTSNGG